MKEIIIRSLIVSFLIALCYVLLMMILGVSGFGNGIVQNLRTFGIIFIINFIGLFFGYLAYVKTPTYLFIFAVGSYLMVFALIDYANTGVYFWSSIPNILSFIILAIFEFVVVAIALLFINKIFDLKREY